LGKRSILVLVAVVTVILVAALGLLGVGPATKVFHRSIDATAHGGIARLEIQPYPEGPVPDTFDRTPSGKVERPLRLVTPYIPSPLPAPLYQGPTCAFGGNLIIRFADGAQVTYGPCRRPASIDRLWAWMIYTLDNGRCLPNCGPGGKPGPEVAP
jgi:hypothetical protein